MKAKTKDKRLTFQSSEEKNERNFKGIKKKPIYTNLDLLKTCISAA